MQYIIPKPAEAGKEEAKNTKQKTNCEKIKLVQLYQQSLKMFTDKLNK